MIPRGGDRVRRIGQGLQEEDPIEPTARDRGQVPEIGQISLDEGQPGIRLGHELTGEIERDHAGGAAFELLDIFGATAATDVQDVEAAHVAEH